MKLDKYLKMYNGYEMGQGKKAFIRFLKANRRTQRKQDAGLVGRPTSLKPFVTPPKPQTDR